jgi:hypothetical protein
LTATIRAVTVAGRDDEKYAGIQNNPAVGAELSAAEIEVDEVAVWEYVNAVGDEDYWAFRAATLARHRLDVAPLTVIDRDISARIVGVPARFGMHAKQEFQFRRPLIVGKSYRLTGRIIDVTSRRGIGYFVSTSECAPVDAPESVAMTSVYTRAYRFPDNQYPTDRKRPPVKLSNWLYESGAQTRAHFPQVGAVVEGRTSLLDQSRLNLYSGPKSDIHTNNMVARRGGLGGTSAQGLMGTELEGELYRQLFGLAFFRRGIISSAYIEPIPSGVSLRAACVVEASDELEIKLRSAVATTTGLVVCVGTASIRHWETDDEIA